MNGANDSGAVESLTDHGFATALDGAGADKDIQRAVALPHGLSRSGLRARSFFVLADAPVEIRQTLADFDQLPRQ
jgi:hypothetical protein